MGPRRPYNEHYLEVPLLRRVVIRAVGREVRGVGFSSVRYRAGRGRFCPQRPRRYTGPGGVFVPFPRPTPDRGPATLIPWTGPRFSPPKIYGGLSRAWPGWGLGRGRGEEKGKNTPRPRPVSGPGRGISPGARVLWGPGGPVTNTMKTWSVAEIYSTLVIAIDTSWGKLFCAT